MLLQYKPLSQQTISPAGWEGFRRWKRAPRENSEFTLAKCGAQGGIGPEHLRFQCANRAESPQGKLRVWG